MVHNLNHSETPHVHHHGNAIHHQPQVQSSSKNIPVKTINLTYQKRPNEVSTKVNKTKQIYGRISPFNTFHYRLMREYLSPMNDRVDLTNLRYSILPKKSSRDVSSISKPSKYSKSINEIVNKYQSHNPKASLSIPIPRWTPTISEKKEVQKKISQSRSLLLKSPMNHRYDDVKKDKTNPNLAQRQTPELTIMPKPITNPLAFFNQTLFKDFTNEAHEDTSMNLATVSDEDESATTSCDSTLGRSTTVSITQKSDHMKPSNDTFELKPTRVTPFWQRAYNTSLPPVVENTHDEEAC